MRLSHRLKKILIVCGSVIAFIAVLACYLLLPRLGKAPDDYVWEGAASFDINSVQALAMPDEGSFRILQLSDTQLDIPFKSRKTLEKVIGTLISDTDPDLIIITGDIVAGVFSHFYIHYIIKLFDSYGIPWAPVFGNHDRELNANLYYQSEAYSNSRYCMFQEGPNNIGGVENYIINIKGGEEVIYTLFLMDSKGDREYLIGGETVKGYDYISSEQIAWYEDNVLAISASQGKTVPSMAFFHIPFPEYLTAYELAESGSSDAEIIGGVKGEGVGCPLENSGFFDKMVELNSTHYVFTGHEHLNNYTVLYQGIYLTYGTKTGNFSTYNPAVNGGTLLTLSAEGTVAIAPEYVQIS